MAGVPGAAGSIVPEERRWVELARIIEGLSSLVLALVGAGGRDSVWVGSLGQTTCRIQDVAQVMGPGANSGGQRAQPNLSVGKKFCSESLTNKTRFKQWGRRCKLVAGAKNDRFKDLCDPMLRKCAPRPFWS